MGMCDYLVEFDRRYDKIKIHNIILPEPVLAYRVLNSANISVEKGQLARATVSELTYSNMQRQLKL